MHAGHAAIGAIAAAGFVADFAFFPAAGWLVDQRGRKVSPASAPATATTTPLSAPGHHRAPTPPPPPPPPPPLRPFAAPLFILRRDNRYLDPTAAAAAAAPLLLAPAAQWAGVPSLACMGFSYVLMAKAESVGGLTPPPTLTLANSQEPPSRHRSPPRSPLDLRRRAPAGRRPHRRRSLVQTPRPLGPPPRPWTPRAPPLRAPYSQHIRSRSDARAPLTCRRRQAWATG